MFAERIDVAVLSHASHAPSINFAFVRHSVRATQRRICIYVVCLFADAAVAALLRDGNGTIGVCVCLFAVVQSWACRCCCCRLRCVYSLRQHSFDCAFECTLGTVQALFFLVWPEKLSTRVWVWKQQHWIAMYLCRKWHNFRLEVIQQRIIRARIAFSNTLMRITISGLYILRQKVAFCE